MGLEERFGEVNAVGQDYNNPFDFVGYDLDNRSDTHICSVCMNFIRELSL